MKEQPEHSLLLKWLILTGLIIFLVFIAWDEGVFTLLFAIAGTRCLREPGAGPWRARLDRASREVPEHRRADPRHERRDPARSRQAAGPSRACQRDPRTAGVAAGGLAGPPLIRSSDRRATQAPRTLFRPASISSRVNW